MTEPVKARQKIGAARQMLSHRAIDRYFGRYFGTLTALAIAFVAILSVSSTTHTTEAQSLPGICGRTPQVQTGILAELSNSACSTVIDSDLAGVTRLQLRGTGIRSFREGDMAGLTGLEWLNFSRNSVTSLPADFWDDLDALTAVVMSNNRFTELGNDFFDASSGESFDAKANIALINASGNRIESIGEDTFDGFSSLEELYLSNNNLSTLPAGVFDGFARLQNLGISFNKLESLPAALFRKMNPSNTACDYSGPLPTNVNASLKEMHLRHNDLTSLPSGIFDCLGALEILSMDYNDLMSLPSGIFDQNTEMVLLDSSFNSISALPQDFLTNNTKLQYLSLANNLLTSLDGAGLEALRELHELHLSNNALSQLPELYVRAFTNPASNGPTATTDGFCLINLSIGGNPFSSDWQASGRLNRFLTHFGSYDPRGVGTCNMSIRWPERDAEDPHPAPDREYFFEDDQQYQQVINSDVTGVEALDIGGIDMSHIVGGGTKSTWELLLDDFTHTDSAGERDRFTSIYIFSFGWDGLTINDAMLDKLPLQLESISVKDATFASDISSQAGEGFDRFDAAPIIQGYNRIDGTGRTTITRERVAHLYGAYFTGTTSFSGGMSRTWWSERGDGLQSLVLDNVGLTGDGSVVLAKLPADKMRWLEIKNNPQLTSIHSSIKTLTGLRGLRIKGSGLTAITPNTFDGLTNLFYLGLRNNKISRVDAGAFNGLDSLRTLFLDGNEISELSSGALNGMPRLRSVSLGQ